MINKNYFWVLCSVLLPFAAHAGGPILYLGDSYTQGTGTPGAALEAALGGPTAVLRYAMVGASSLDYARDMVCPRTGCRADYSIPGHPNGAARTPLPANFGGLAKLLGEQRAKPARVVIALGTNDAAGYCTGSAGMPAAAGKLAGQARAAGVACTWIGPISFLKGSQIYGMCGARYDEYVDALKAAVTAAGCSFLDMRRAGNTARGCAADNPHFLEPDPAKNCSLQATDGPKLHFRAGDAQIGMWAKYAAGHIQ